MRVIDFFDKGVADYPNNIAFEDGDEKLTYKDASLQTKRFAKAIRGHGYGKGTHIGVYAPNSNNAFIALISLMRAEGVWLPINPRNTVDVNIDLLFRFDGELLFYHSAFEKEVQQMLREIPSLKEAICLDKVGDAGPYVEKWMEGFDSDYQVGPEEEGDMFAIFPTGGTTGKPKGVMVNHPSVETFFANYYAHFKYYDDTCHLVVAPMTHSAGIMGCLHFNRGGKNVIVPSPTPDGVLKAIEEFKVTHLFLPPTVLYMMLAHPDVNKYDYSSLQHFLVAAAPSSVEKLKEAVKVFGPVMTEAFGQTEAPAAVCCKAPWDYIDKDGNINEERLATVGRVAAFTQAAILDDEGNELPRGEAGEICVRGRLVNPGYYKDPEATAEIHKFGWHHTGDVGVMDEDGFVKIVDRKKDMIITGGFNVFPNEIEQVLQTHPAVQEAAVIGIPDDKWGEAVKGVVLLKPDQSVEAETLISLVKEKIGSVKAPKSIDFVSDLPRSPAGKVVKTEIRKPYWEGKSRGVN